MDSFFAGSGYATIKLKRFTGANLNDFDSTKVFNKGYRCDLSGDKNCDPYVQVYVNGEKVLVTDTKIDTVDYLVNRIYFTPKPIQKNKTEILIKVRDDDSKEGEERTDENSEPMLWTKGTVESFQRVPHRCNEKGYQNNCLDIDIIWQDVRKET